MRQQPENRTLLAADPLPRGQLAPGDRAGDYVIDAYLAKGGCGAVYRAHHGIASHPAAVKVLHGLLATSPRMVERFVREVEVVNVLRHPGIVQIFDIGTLEDGRPFYAMELLHGPTLDTLLAPGQRLSPDEALEIFEPLCAALGAAHAAGIVHRDVKPSNVAVDLGPPIRVKLLDFGIAKLTTPELHSTGLTSAGRLIGTPTIMAPEQILGAEVDARADIYALGVLLYRMLVGRLPFEALDSAELSRQHLEVPAPRPSLRGPVPPALDAVVLRALEKLPEHRFDSASAFLNALELAAGRAPVPGLRDHVVQAAGIHLDVRVRCPDDEVDDDLVADLGRVLDLAEARLCAGGFWVASATGNQILAVLPLPEPADLRREALACAITLAGAIHRAIVERSAPDPRIHPNLCVHVDEAVVHAGERRAVVGGAIACVSAWAPREDVASVAITAAAALAE
jgi:eukaryotic-like serine/threonine-protein kinase